jgi:hypothetical protein
MVTNLALLFDMNCSVSPLAEMRPPPSCMGSRFDQARSMSNNLQAMLFTNPSGGNEPISRSASPQNLPDSSPSFLAEERQAPVGLRRTRKQRAKTCLFPLPDLSRSQSPITSLAADMSQNFHIART